MHNASPRRPKPRDQRSWRLVYSRIRDDYAAVTSPRNSLAGTKPPAAASA